MSAGSVAALRRAASRERPRRPSRSATRHIALRNSLANQLVSQLIPRRGVLCVRSRPAVRSAARSAARSAVRGLYPAAHLAQWVASEDHLVAVLQKGARGAVLELDRLLSVPAQLDEAAALVWLGAGDRAGGEEVAGPQPRSVHREVGHLLCDRPVQVARVRARHDRFVQLHLERDVERPWILAQVLERLGLLWLARHAPVRELGERN